MAAPAPQVGSPTGESMGCKNDLEDQTVRINHADHGSSCNLNGNPFGALNDGHPVPQAVVFDSSVKNQKPEADASTTDLSPEEMSKGEAAESSQLQSDAGQTALPPGKKRRKRRGGKRIGYIKKNAKKIPVLNAAPKKDTSGRAPVKRKRKIAIEAFPHPPVQHNSPAAPEAPETTPSGRPKRRAAKAALEYLHSITQDLEQTTSGNKERDSPVQPASPSQRKTPGRQKGRKRKAPDYNSSQYEDTDFNPEGHEDVGSEDDDDDDDDDFEDEMLGCLNKKAVYKDKMVGSNGLSSMTMQPLWTSFKNTKKFREEHYSSWVFPDWIPSVSDWNLLSNSEVESYLPQEKESATFTLSREGSEEESSLHNIRRFESLPPHTERWDSMFFVGGPVWAMEWCPCPEGAAETQYAALYCNKGMDDRHKMNVLYNEHALLQLWDLGRLQMTKPTASPCLAYALALDDGCIWSLKWCPAGAWELPATYRKAPHIPRLGLIAAAFSNGTIAVYSLPHPEALKAHNQAAGDTGQAPQIYRVRRILTAKLGSSQADHRCQSGQCFTLDWLPIKPHNILVAGFYDGMVALWDLQTKSSLLRIRSPDKSLCLYPYHCFIAHDNTIRSISWCRASSELLVTVGDDRMVKLWNITKTCVPLKATKRFLPTGVSWPIFWSGIFLTQESCFSTFGQQGLHYLDSGYFGQKPFFVCTRKATVWSLSVSDWMNSCVVSDNAGYLVYSLLCDPDSIFNSSKKHRFPLYRTELVQFRPGQRVGQAEEEEQLGDASHQEPQSYRGATKKYYLHFHDMDLRYFTRYQQRPIVKQLHTSEIKGMLFVDQMPLNALYKVRFNPNMDAHCWVLSAGQSGLVRVHCVRGLTSSVMKKLIHEAQAQFSAMFRTQEPDNDTTAVHHCTVDTVQVR